MEHIVPLSKVTVWMKKNKYVAVILLLGILLMTLPDFEETEPKTISPQEDSELEADLSCSLASILSQIDGAGKVEVLLTIAAGEETIYQTNEEYDSDNNSVSTKVTTVTITDADKNQSGLVQKINPPTYLGAIVVCQGADQAAVRLAIVEAVANATGLGADKISVLKMK